jgi:O-antigen ligase
MNNTLAIIRSLIIYGLCLPLAIYIGYLLANPADRAGLTVIVVACFLPLIPVLLRWHHLMLIISWNMSMVLFFIQGSPYLWMAMTALSLSLTILQHILKRNVEFLAVRSVIVPLLFLTFVILVTAKLTGGIGLAAFGSDSYGGRRYIQMFCGIAGFFAITSHRIPPGQANLYVGLFFLSTLTTVVGSLAPWLPGGMRVVFALFPVDSLASLYSDVDAEFMRLGGLTSAAMAALCFILARHGLGGLVNLGESWRFLPLRFRGGMSFNQPWRLLAFAAAGATMMLGGYRSYAITILLFLGLLFYFEGLIRTRLLPLILLLGVLMATVALPFVDKLPYTVQRTLSFLPIAVDPLVKAGAESSSEWRINIWREVIPTIPQYLLIGKGYSIDSKEMEKVAATDQGASGAMLAELASDYHNGPLSLLIPLGLFGFIGFTWFLIASFRVLLNNRRHGLPEHQHLNNFLLVYFLTKTIMFFVIFGSFQGDLAIYCGIVALSISLNGGMRKPATAAANPQPTNIPFRLPKAARA